MPATVPGGARLPLGVGRCLRQRGHVQEPHILRLAECDQSFTFECRQDARDRFRRQAQEVRDLDPGHRYIDPLLMGRRACLGALPLKEKIRDLLARCPSSEKQGVIFQRVDLADGIGEQV